MNTLIIFGAEYLYLVSVLLFLFVVYKLPSNERKRFVLLSFLAFALAFVIAIIARNFFFNPRPFVVDNFKPLVPHEADNGFPSDHSLLVGAIASVVLVYKRQIGLVLAILALAVGISRVLAGVHHPIDILGSFIIAALSAWIIQVFIKRAERGKISG